MMNEARRKKLKARKKRMQDQASGGSMIFIKPDTTLRVRALPVADDEEFGLEIVHFYLGQEIKGVVSPATFGEPCAIYEAHQKLLKSKDEADKDLAQGTLKPKRKYVVPVVKYKDTKGTKVDENSGAKLILLTNQAYQSMVDYSLDSEHGDFTDPKEGYDLKITRSGSGQFDTEYTVMNCRPTPLAKKFNKVYNVEEMLRKEMPSYEETKEILERFMGEAPKKKKKKKVSSNDAPVKKKKKRSSDL